MNLLTILAYSVAISVSIPLFVLSIECLLALLPRREFVGGARQSCVVLIPAHNEELDLASTLENVSEQLEPNDRVLVVADNCTDGTAALARRHATEVVVRNDVENRGKGFALDAGIQYLKQTCDGDSGSPDVVVVLDADCTFAPGALDRLVRAAAASQGPVQAQYLMHAREGSGPGRRVSAFAFLTKNLVRPRGLSRIGLWVPLTGSGMAFPWLLMKDLQLATSEIVEDLQLGLNLVLQGHGPAFCEDARVDSHFPEADAAARRQRTRWEHGYLGQMRSMLPSFLRQVRRGNVRASAAFLDLMVPPLSLLVLLAAIAAGILLTFFAVSDNVRPLAICLLACTTASLGLTGVWFRFGRETVGFQELLRIPIYVLGKLPIYALAPFSSNRVWIRTERTGKKVE